MATLFISNTPDEDLLLAEVTYLLNEFGAASGYAYVASATQCGEVSVNLSALAHTLRELARSPRSTNEDQLTLF